MWSTLTDSSIDRAWTGRLHQERARPDSIRAWPHAWKLAVAVVCFGAFMGQLDASVVTLTYRPVEAEFHAGLAAVEWVSLAYLLTLIALLVPVGKVSDRLGRKLIYLDGFVVFTAASAACGLAPSLSVLIAFRIVQAVGAAMLQANSVALVTSSPPAHRRRDALGLQAAAQALGLALGPSVGGVIVSTVGWRWVFFVNVPVGLVAVVAGHYLLPRTRERSGPAPLDWRGVVVLGVATTALLLGVSALSGLAVPVELVIGAFVIAVVSGWAFVARLRRVEHPLVDVSLLHDPVISRGLIGALCGYFVLFGPLVLVPITLGTRGVSALHSGLVLTALPAGFAIAAVAGPAVAPSALSEHGRAALGAVISSAALAVTLLVPPTPLTLAPLLALIGFGLGIFTPSNNALVMGAVPARAAASGGGLLNLTRGLGTALGVAAVTLALHVGGRHGDRLAVAVLLSGALVATIASLDRNRSDSDRPSTWA
jgi:EmrB/QacA subfamily drug resistance transporter